MILVGMLNFAFSLLNFFFGIGRRGASGAIREQVEDDASATAAHVR